MTFHFFTLFCTTDCVAGHSFYLWLHSYCVFYKLYNLFYNRIVNNLHGRVISKKEKVKNVENIIILKQGYQRYEHF